MAVVKIFSYFRLSLKNNGHELLGAAALIYLFII